MGVSEVKGDLIAMAQNGGFDVIVHGCNSFCKQGAGIAKRMDEVFKTGSFTMESPRHRGDINKLGCIDFEHLYLEGDSWVKYPDEAGLWATKELVVVNAYTQYGYGRDKMHLDYDALSLCMKKINHIFKGKHIGIPYLIGCGLAGGDSSIVLDIIKVELKDMRVSLVKLPNYEGK